MAIKICSECEFSKKEPMPGPQGLQMALVCTNDNCRDPVEGALLPCSIARRELVFCGITGKYWKLKELPPQEPVVKLITS